jgi:hypothetical protein
MTRWANTDHSAPQKISACSIMSLGNRERAGAAQSDEAAAVQSFKIPKQQARSKIAQPYLPRWQPNATDLHPIGARQRL